MFNILNAEFVLQTTPSSTDIFRIIKQWVTYLDRMHLKQFLLQI